MTEIEPAGAATDSPARSPSAGEVHPGHEDPPNTFTEHLAVIARRLYTVARTEEPVSGVDLDIALSARRGLLDLLSTVHTDLTGIGATTAPAHPEDLEIHPVAALGQALRRHPRPPGHLSPTDVALARPTGPAGEAWQRIARHTLLARHIWSTGLGDAPVDPARR